MRDIIGFNFIYIDINISNSFYLQVTELLIRKGANLNDKNKEFLVPLHIASDKAHVEIVEVLLKHGANINSLDCLGQTALHRAAHLGLAQVCYLMSQSFQIE